MHLKEVRMYNFKSFGEKLVVPFQPGFTAITGPNGSGKSNIGDAILFVLGPRSTKKIRAKKLTELIFNGGKSGKGGKECEVTLVFDNSDRVLPLEEDEVRLTRRIRKAPKRGDPDNYYSYCYVNDRSTNLREFVDLLKHARITAEGYNIVTQGSVNDLVLMSDLERRRILEEIAGITDFDKDIEGANKKREEVEHNLDRVEIVLKEIRRSLADLEKERDSAQKHKELTQKRGELKAVFAFKKKDELERQIAETQTQIQRYESERKELATKLEELRVEHKQTLGKQHELERKIGDMAGPDGDKTKQQIRGLQDEAVRLEERVNYAADESKDLRDAKRAAEAELKRVQKELADIDRSREGYETEASEKLERAKAAEKELKTIRDAIGQSSDGAMRINAELAKLKVAFEDTSAQTHKATLERDRLQQRIDDTQGLIRQIEENLESYEIEIKDCQFQLKELGQSSKSQSSALEKLQNEHVSLLKKQSELAKQMGDLEAATRRLQRDYHELKALEEASKNVGQGYSRAVDAVLAARRKGQLKGIHGTIAELGKVDSKNETALQVAAGPRLMSIVVEDDGAAAAAIEYLRTNNLGRAAFLPLNKMVRTNPRGKALLVIKDEQSMGFALDLVSYSKKYEAAFSYVFGDTLVMKDLQAARKHMGGVRLVTLKGDLIEAAGAMVGGSMRKQDQIKFAGKDASKLADVEAELARNTGLMNDLGEELAELRKQIQGRETELSSARSQESGGLRIRDLEARKTQFEAKLQQAKKDLGERQAVLRGLEDSFTKCEARIDEGSKRLEELEAKRQETGKLLLKGTKKEIAESARQLEVDAARLKDEHLQAKANVETMGRQRALVAEKAGELEARIKEVTTQLATFAKDGDAHKAKLKQIQEKLGVLTKAEVELNKESKGLYESKEKLAVKLKELEGRVDTLQTKMSTQESLAFQHKNKLPAIEEELGNQLAEIKEFGLNPPHGESNLTLDEARKQLAQVERDLNALGPVNQRALEMVDEQTKREAELLDEVQRLQKQRENLIQVVDEITQKKKAGLMVVFEAVNENLKRIYGQLSNGGDAYLELENPEKPFEAGLVMKAQPPGKRVQRLQALSGGEKSMTALALIFAIQEYEPSPFYLLDEVDQNLDGVNAELVARMISRDARTAQFIIVSLRKVTLKESDHIYGVTMAGNGLSQMIANFDFNRLNDQGEFVQSDGSGSATAVLKGGKGGDGDGNDGAGRKGIRETVATMVKVEVDK